VSRGVEAFAAGDGGYQRGGREGKAFQTLFNDAVVVGLAEVLGSAGARAALFHLGLMSGFGAAEVHKKLCDVFGMGTPCLESSILRTLYAKAGLTFDPEESKTFADYVAGARKDYLKKVEG
jgi:hypothetical protein